MPKDFQKFSSFSSWEEMAACKAKKKTLHWIDVRDKTEALVVNLFYCHSSLNLQRETDRWDEMRWFIDFRSSWNESFMMTGISWGIFIWPSLKILASSIIFSEAALASKNALAPALTLINNDVWVALERVQEKEKKECSWI